MNKKIISIVKKNGFAVFLVMLTLNSIAIAQEFKKTATAGFTFLEIPVTARAAAMGEATIALSDNYSSSLFTNPGTLGFATSNHSASFSYAPWFADIKQLASSYAYQSNFGVIGVGFIMFDYGSMPRTVIASGQKVYAVTGTFDAGSLAFGLSFSRKLTENFSFGLTLKYVQEKIDIYKATNILFDGGFLYYTGLGSFRIAGAIQNFGVNSKFINDEFKMPSLLRLGVASEVFGNDKSDYKGTIVVEALHASNNTEKVNFGGEVSWMGSLFIRGGYKFFYDEDGYSFGFGVKNSSLFPIAFDYSLSDYGRLGKISRISLQLCFN